MHFCCFEAEGKCLYNRITFTRVERLSRDYRALKYVSREEFKYAASTIYCLISLAHERTKQTPLFPLQLSTFSMAKPINCYVTSSLLELDEVFFKVILQSRLKWRGF